MPAPPLVALTLGVRLDEPLPTFYACVAVLVVVAWVLGSTAVPGAGRAWVVERVGVIAVIAWAAGLDVAMLARAFLAGNASGETEAFLLAAAAYICGTAWTFSAARDFEWRWILTCVGSAYYHLAPSDTRLIWDRLPMTLVFMSFLAAVMAEGRSPRWEVLILSPLLVVGLGSVWWWKASGDLLPYVLVQFGPAIVMLPAFWRATGKRWLWRIAALYAAAKIAELCDPSIYSALPWSGHTWKHLLGAAAGYCIVRWFCDSSQTVIRSSGDNLTSSVVSIYNEGGSDSAV